MNKEIRKEGGLRTIGLGKKSTSDSIVITIITVVYNNVFSIEETIKSVINQSYNNIEYIIIDGGSNDGTVEIIKKYADKIDYWSSEKDFGLYYAMNRGLEIATGDWINYMNSGDCFSENVVIEKIFKDSKTDAGVIYGNVNFNFDGIHHVYVKANSLNYLWKGMQFVHQASFVSTKIMKKFPFDTNYKLIADYKSLYLIYLSDVKFKYVDMAICDFLAGGLSDNNPKSIIECQKLIFPIHNNLKVRIYYYYRYVQCTIRYNLAKIIGQLFYAKLRVFKSNLKNIFLK